MPDFLRFLWHFFDWLFNTDIEEITFHIFSLNLWNFNPILVVISLRISFDSHRFLNDDVMVLGTITRFTMVNVMNLLRFGLCEDSFLTLMMKVYVTQSNLLMKFPHTFEPCWFLTQFPFSPQIMERSTNDKRNIFIVSDREFPTERDVYCSQNSPTV